MILMPNLLRSFAIRAVCVFSEKNIVNANNSICKRLPSITTFKRNYCERKNPDISNIPELHEPPFKDYYQAYFTKLKGKVFEKKPFKVKCTKGKIYYWCPCGQSHDQPFCDGQCILPEMRIKMRPAVFKPRATREYWFCNCKQTKNPPFCDGTHNTPEVQEVKPIVGR